MAFALPLDQRKEDAMKIPSVFRSKGPLEHVTLILALSIVAALLPIMQEIAVTPLEHAPDFFHPYKSFLLNRDVRPSSINTAELCSLILIGYTGTPAPDHRAPLSLSQSPDSPTLPEPDQFDTKLSKGKFLVASRRLGDPRFQETVVLLLSYNRNGSVGLIINRPVKMSLSDAFPDTKIFKKRKETVYFGGPVELNRLLFLIRSPGIPEESVRVFDGVYVSSSRPVLDRIIDKPKAGEHIRVYAGYAGWAAGQLEGEVARGDWHVIQADAKTVFDKKSEKIWPELIRRGSELQVRNSRQTLIL
jgi:putative transcriptional regulator